MTQRSRNNIFTLLCLLTAILGCTNTNLEVKENGVASVSTITFDSCNLYSFNAILMTKEFTSVFQEDSLIKELSKFNFDCIDSLTNDSALFNNLSQFFLRACLFELRTSNRGFNLIDRAGINRSDRYIVIFDYLKIKVSKIDRFLTSNKFAERILTKENFEKYPIFLTYRDSIRQEQLRIGKIKGFEY